MATGTQNEHEQTISDRLTEYCPRRAQRYDAAHVLLLSWKDEDIGLGPEMAELSQMFRECFNYEVLEYPIPSNDPKSSLNLEVARFFHLFGQRDDSLIIIYYSGHGGPKSVTRSPCTWAAKLSGGPSLDWSEIQPQVFRASCDVVIILDCCFAGQAARTRVSNSVEFLAATDQDQITPTGTGLWPSFTKVLMREMRDMVTKHELVTISDLQRRMVEDRAGLKRQPFFVRLSGDASAGPIKLPRLDDKTASSLASQDSLYSMILRLSYSAALDSETVTTLVRWLTKDSPPSIENIQLVDRVLSDAKEANVLGAGLVDKDSETGGRLLPYLSEEGQQEARRLFAQLRASLSGPAQGGHADTGVIGVISRVKEASSNLVAFVADSLSGLDATMLYEVRAAGSFAQDLKSRIAMRLALIDENSPDNYIRVDFGDNTQAGQRLRLGKRSGQLVLVEYINYEDGDKHIKQQVRRVSVLHSVAKAPAFRSLHGLGFLQETLVGPRFGMVYALPDALRDRQFKPLSDLIANEKLVALDVRAKCASSLCDAVLHLHSIGWFHKSIRSDNILIFSKTSEGQSGLPTAWDFENPYLIGFDCSRPADAETRHTVDFATRNNIYRHPDRWGRPAQFENYHDLYALGILLTEIGCWRTLPSMDSKGSGFDYIRDPETLRDFLLAKASAKLAHAAGTKYAEAVRICFDRTAWKGYENWASQRIIRDKVIGPIASVQ